MLDILKLEKHRPPDLTAQVGGQFQGRLADVRPDPLGRSQGQAMDIKHGRHR
jgi:hypothetical protein